VGHAATGMMLHARGIEQQSKGVDNVLAASTSGWPPASSASPAAVSTITGQGNGQGGREHGHKCDQLPGNRDISNPEHREHVASVWGCDVDEIPGKGIPPRRSSRRSTRARSRACCRSASTRSSRCPTPTSPPRRSTSWSSTRHRLLPVRVRPPRRHRAARLAARGGRGHGHQRRGPHHQDQRCGRPAGRGPARLADPRRHRQAARQGRVLPVHQHRADLRRALPGLRRGHRRLQRRHLGTHRGRAGHVLADPRGGPPGHAPPVRGRPVLHPDGKARFHADALPECPAEVVDDEYPVWLTTGRVVSQYLSGTQTRRIGRWSTSTPSRCARCTPARRRSVSSTATWSRSRRGAATSPCRPRGRTTIRPDTVFIPYHWPGNKAANQLTNRAVDPISKMPEFKVAAVRVAKADGHVRSDQSRLRLQDETDEAHR
jgi:assimilatory nitrate reductase catalytic subunit